MGEKLRKSKRMVIVAYLILVHSALLFLLAERFLPQLFRFPRIETSSVADPTQQQEIPTPLPVPSLLADIPNSNGSNSANIGNRETPASPQQPTEVQHTPALIVPVAGISREQLVDTFTAARSEGRTHDAIDIPAASGTPVLAAADGTIAKFWDSEKGGITIYELSADHKYFYYYAHLQKRAEGLREGDIVHQGTVIGFVGDTGNAGPGNYHLHFGMSIATDPKRYWGGTDVNPYPLLRYPNGQ
jgi:murein DD-endopeptidase MepM/ murein hydrolase activator NlpD